MMGYEDALVRGQEEERDAVLFRPIFQTGWGFYLVTAALLGIIGFSLYAYVHQVTNGLGVTGMNKPVYWGLYITNFVFFVGISHAGTLISAILRVTQAEWRRPVTRCAEAITVFALVVGPINVIIDLGRPDHLLNVIKFGRFESPLLWDVMSIGTYLVGSLIYLYLPLIPDLALARQRTPRGSWRYRFYEMAALGYTGTEEQKHRLERAVSIMAVVIIPIAVSVHTVVSWVFAMTVQPMWHSAIFGPYFVVGAIFSGIATLLIAMAVLRKVLGLEDYLTDKTFNNLGLMLLGMCLIWLYMTFAEHLTVFYGAEPDEMKVLDAKLTGEFDLVFWGMVLVTFVIPFFILAFNRTRKIPGIVIASILINIGMWIERYQIVVPTLSRPRLDYLFGSYFPSWVEWSILAGELAVFSLLYVLFTKVFPIVSVWEVREGQERQAHAARAPSAEAEAS